MNLSYSIIIPSRNIDNLAQCIARLREKDERANVIVVWDGDTGVLRKAYPRSWGCWTVMRGIDPFIFARNINLGIRTAVAWGEGVVLLNDDCLLKTPKGFALLHDQIAAHPEYGALCPGFDLGGCRHHNLVGRKRPEIAPEPIMLIFACCYIPRSTIARVGLLDERFCVNAGGPGKRGYGLEDDDYSLRIREAGLKLGVYDGCAVDHTTLRSTFRHDPEHPVDVRAHEELFKQIHGHWPEGHGYSPR